MKTGLLKFLRSLGKVNKQESVGATTYSINTDRFAVQIFIFKRNNKPIK